MNRKLKIFSLSLGILLPILLSATPIFAADQAKIPSSVNGLPVIFIKTSENTLYLDEHEKILVLFDNASSTGLESIEKYSIFEYFEENPLPKGFSLQIYAGEGASIEEFMRMHKKNNATFEKYGHIQLGGQIAYSEQSGTKSCTTYYQTYAGINILDTPGDDVQGLHIEIEAPEVGDNQSDYSALLVNGWSNNDFFMQAGQLYYSGQGYNVWADSESSYQVRCFDVDYVEGHDYAYVIAYYGGGDWIYVCGDTNSAQSDTYVQHDASGSYLIRDINTSVFFENWNTNADWYEDFSNPLTVWDAEDLDYSPYSWSEWDNTDIFIVDTNQYVQDNDILEIIFGDLSDDTPAYCDLENVLLRGS